MFPARAQSDSAQSFPSQNFNFLSDLLDGLEINGQKRYGPLQIFYLRSPLISSLEYATLDEALAGKEIVITELSEAGQVPKIKVVNSSHRMVFLMAGEGLIGCKQNRVVNASIMVPARTEVPLPVTCVERGRWGYQSRRFSSADSSSHYALRAMMANDAARSYRRVGTPASNQAAVWNEVARKMEVLGVSSPSGALHEAYQHFASELTDWEEQVKVPDKCSGAVFVVGENIVGADLFDKPDTLQKLWPKLIRSCAIDALESPTESQGLQEEEISSWLRKASSARRETFATAGVGVDVRMESEAVIGASLVVDDQPVHTELFPRKPQVREATPPLEFPRPSAPEEPSGTVPHDSWLRRLFRK